MPPIHRTVSLENSGEEPDSDIRLSLLGAFELTEGVVPVVLSGSSQRLIAFVALQGRPITRDATAFALWPEASETQAHASLRSAIWRLEELARETMQINVLELDLTEEVRVDFRDAEALAHRVLIVDTMPSDEDMSLEAMAALSSELLPDWWEDWSVIKAEDWRQLRLHALEALGEKLLEAERYGDAIEAARSAMKADPLRESPHALLIRIHLVEGNQSEALREFTEYRELMLQDLGIEPTAQLLALVRDLQR